jgi:hypothetical protein
MALLGRKAQGAKMAIKRRNEREKIFQFGRTQKKSQYRRGVRSSLSLLSSPLSAAQVIQKATYLNQLLSEKCVYTRGHMKKSEQWKFFCSLSLSPGRSLLACFNIISVRDRENNYRRIIDATRQTKLHAFAVR